MCGRFTLIHSPSEIAKTFHLVDIPSLEPRYNIAPSQPVTTIVRSSSKSVREFKWLRWGLIPHWAKNSRIGYKLINARAETVGIKPSFRTAFRRSRCLIITSGFYEWQQLEDRKQPFFIHRKDSLPFALAGLWSDWQSPDGETISTCTIITTQANDMMQPIHQRMPVILDSSDYDLWCDPSVKQPELLQPLLKPDSSDLLEAYPVSTLVNNPRHDSPDCLKLWET